MNVEMLLTASLTAYFFPLGREKKVLCDSKNIFIYFIIYLY